jgi:hypothetical protein
MVSTSLAKLQGNIVALTNTSQALTTRLDEQAKTSKLLTDRMDEHASQLANLLDLEKARHRQMDDHRKGMDTLESIMKKTNNSITDRPDHRPPLNL